MTMVSMMLRLFRLAKDVAIYVAVLPVLVIAGSIEGMLERKDEYGDY